MEEILQIIDNLLRNDTENDNARKQFYKIFGGYNFVKRNEEKYLIENLLPKIYKLCEKKVIRKDILFLTSTAYENVNILEKCTKYEKDIFKLNVRDSSSLYDYCIFQNQHWFLYVLNNYEEIKSILDTRLYNKILTLKLIQLTNSFLDIAKIKCLLEEINTNNLDEFWKYYINEIGCLVEIICYCKENVPDIDIDKILLFACKNCTLETFSKYINIRKANWDEILLKLFKDEKLHPEIPKVQSENFIAFTILGHIFKTLTGSTDSNVKNNHFVENIKTKLLSLKNKSLQIDLLEDIFVTIFTKNSHFLNIVEKEEYSEEYICKEKDIRLILYLLKSIVDEIKLKNINRESEDYNRFSKLHNYITDAVWRLQLIDDVKNPKKCESNLLPYMLSPPKSLIQMCLNRGDFERAFQVIGIFSIKGVMVSEIEYAEKLQNLRDNLKKTFKMRAIQKENPNITTTNVTLAVDKIIENFFKNNTVVCNEEIEGLISKYSEKHLFFDHFKSKNENFMNMFDLAITQPKNFEDCEVMLQLAFDNNTLNNNISSNYSIFCKQLLDIYKEVGYNKKLTAGEILTSSFYSTNLNSYKREESFYENLAELYKEFNENIHLNENGVLNNSHPSHRTLLKLNKLCNEYVEWKQNTTENVKYISKLYSYLKAFSRILYIEQNTSDIISNGKNTSYFDLLYFNRSELMGKLLFERHLDPSEFERYFGKLKLDYLYHVIGNCFPTINLHTVEHVTKEELYPENSLYIPSKNIITYIQKRNWLLAFILNEMFKVDGVKLDISNVRVQPFLNYLNLPKIQHLRALFDNNDIITALQNDISSQKVSDYINKQILKYEGLVSSQHSQVSNDSFETAEEILEDAIKTTNWKALYDLIDSIPENQLKKDRVLLELKDMVLINLVQDGFEIDFFKYVQFINDDDLRVSIILYNMKEWPGEFCMHVIKSEITKFDSEPKINELKMWMQQVELCEELKPILTVPKWSKVLNICEMKPEDVISKLLLYDQLGLFLKFIELHKPKEELLLEVDEIYLQKVFESGSSDEQIKLLLDKLPYTHSIKLCYNLLRYLKKLEHLQFVVNYLMLNNACEAHLKNITLSLKMLSVFTQNEQEQLFCLIYEPLNIIEVLIMNTKLNKLSAVLNILQPDLLPNEFGKENLCVEKIDQVLRYYAEKSLDFRVITQPNPRLLRTPECKLMQSLDTLNIGPYTKEFIMPVEVPTKDEWVPNNEVLECMCCQQVTFSMFNRRHHCRRCGRVICYNCSLHRMLVPSYEDILVRVCIDCYKQTVGESDTSEINDSVSTKSIVHDYWLLTDDLEHNKVVREEFSYEHAPSVSLCLSIMKFHSKSDEYPKFLLDQCNIMLKLLQPNQEPIQEIDYLLVIKMLKSLAVAAKMSATECTLHYGISLADRILSQAELLGLLAERGCLSLLPISSTHSQGSFIDAVILRKLRDRLLEREQWNLALEVSTKAGLENTGVFAAWGKSCLKAGSLLAAREKFHRCLDKTGHYESISDTSQSEFDESSGSFSRSRYMLRSPNINILSESKPMKNPPLLNEIIYILESKTRSIEPDIAKQIDNQKLTNSTLSLNQSFGIGQPDTAVSILNKLRNLKNISAGNYYQSVEKDTPKLYYARPCIDGIFYDECVYYLTKYGTRLSLLEFFVKHGDIDRALNYMVDNQLGSDMFIEIYMRCLKDGIINILYENMSKIDSTLDVWKDYLRTICRHLEKHSMLNSLYQLQQFMGDYIRAAMTCIRFYQENVTSFTDLCVNVNFLHKAEQHLKHILEQEQWVEVATVRRLSSASKQSFEEKGIINPSLVMKISPKDVDKHINTIWRQIEVVEFLAQCESNGIKPMQILSNILPAESTESLTQLREIKLKIPTLFGPTQEKLYLAVLAIVCGKNVEDGFDIALRIIQEFKLKPVKVYCEAGKQLAKKERYSGIGQLVTCIKSSGTNDNVITDMCDEMLSLAVATFIKANVTGAKVEDLIKLIFDRATKISAYIEAKQLKTAYFLAVKYKRMSDIRRILREAELLNQPSIKGLCQKVLQSHSHTPTHSKES